MSFSEPKSISQLIDEAFGPTHGHPDLRIYLVGFGAMSVLLSEFILRVAESAAPLLPVSSFIY
jgi:hypothetical protein